MDNAYLDENYLTRREGLFRVRLTARTTVSGKYVYSGYEVIPDPTALAGLAVANPGRSFDPTACPLFEINNTEVSVSGEPIVWARLRSSEGGVPSYEFINPAQSISDAARNVRGVINTTYHQVFGLGSKIIAGTTTATEADLMLYVGSSSGLPTGWIVPEHFIGPGITARVKSGTNEPYQQGFSIGCIRTDIEDLAWTGFAISVFDYREEITGANSQRGVTKELVFSEVLGCIACVRRDADGLVMPKEEDPDPIWYEPVFAAYGFAIVNDAGGITRGGSGTLPGGYTVEGGIITDMTGTIGATGWLPGQSYVNEGILSNVSGVGYAVSGTFTTADGKTITVFHGVISSIV